MNNETELSTNRHRQQRAVDTRLSILTHAATLFSQRGFDGCSTRDIASAAGISHANIRYHFKDKETLWHSVIEHLRAQAYHGSDLLAALDGSDTPTELFRQHTRNAISYLANQPELPRIIYFERLHKTARLGDIENIMREIDDERVGHIRKMQSAGVIKSDIDPKLLNELIGGGMADRFIIDPIEDDQERQRLIEAFTDLVVRLVESP